MTRKEFDEQVTSWEELIDFCDNNRLCACEDVYHYEQINDLIYDTLNSDGAKYVYFLLCNIEDFDGEYFSYRDGELTNLYYDDFEEYRNNAADEFDDFEEEYDEEYEYEENLEDVEEDIFLKIIS